jgi:RNA polymerase sigma-70 factor, ECF subfamily
MARERAEETHTEAFEEAAAEPFSAAEAAEVHRALDQLEPRHRGVLVLHFLEDFSLDEIAQITGCPPGTIKSRLHYAKRAMRAVLSGGTYERRT